MFAHQYLLLKHSIVMNKAYFLPLPRS
jgi:hypothetical protein